MLSVESMFWGSTFDDFLFEPQYNLARSRLKDVRDFSMPLTRRLTLQVPLVGANMDTVTGKEMAKALALEGGIGFLHRNCPIDTQANWVKYVKTRHAYVIEHPIVLPKQASMAQAKYHVDQHHASGILIETEPDSAILAGILSHRDIPWDDDDLDLTVPVEKFMTPLADLVTAQEDITMEDAKKQLFTIKKEKLPLVDADGRIRGLITMRDLKLFKQKPNSSKDTKGRLMVGGTIGATRDYMERAEALLAAGADCLLMDVAHAHSEVVKEAMQTFRAKFPDVDLVVGNVATVQGALFLAGLGADAIKVGVGPGRGCRTRLETGAGVPQLQAIRSAFCATDGRVPIIADGGIKHDKDIFMAVACGATTVMVGSMFAGTDEAPGRLITDPRSGKKFKVYRGMTSPQAVLDGASEEDADDALETPPEGQTVEIEHKGSVVQVVQRIVGHLRSSISYAGELTLRRAHEKISGQPGKYLVQLSESARRESFER